LIVNPSENLIINSKKPLVIMSFHQNNFILEYWFDKYVIIIIAINKECNFLKSVKLLILLQILFKAKYSANPTRNKQTNKVYSMNWNLPYKTSTRRNNYSSMIELKNLVFRSFRFITVSELHNHPNYFSLPFKFI
jgi:hypothetical protein